MPPSNLSKKDDVLATMQDSPYFELEHGSNYLITLTYGKEEIVEFDQFKKLMSAIFKGGGEWVTINKRGVKKSDVRGFEPTAKLTDKQQALAVKKERETEAAKARMREIIETKQKFDVKYYNNKYGKGNWSKLPRKDKDLKVLDKNDYKECFDAFIAENPILSADLKETENI